MKNMILALALLFSATAQAAGPIGSIGVSPQVQMGQTKNTATSTTILPLADIIGTGAYTRITIKAGDSTSTDAAWYGFAKMGGATGHYQVTTGKTLYCFTLYVTNGGSQYYTFGYSTADFTEETTSAPTGAVYYSVLAASRLNGDLLASTSTVIPDSVPYFVTFPSLSYPYMYLGKNAIDPWTLRFDCVEK